MFKLSAAGWGQVTTGEREREGMSHSALSPINRPTKRTCCFRFLSFFFFFFFFFFFVFAGLVFSFETFPSHSEHLMQINS